MKSFPHHVLLFATFTLVTHIKASSILSALTLNGNSRPLNVSISGGQLRCFDWGIRHTRRTKIIDCARVIARLPYYHLPGEFHNDQPVDIFSLPHIQQFDRCQVSVTINAQHGRDASSWLAVHAAASDIVFGCVYDYSTLAETGGELTVGNENKIRVTVERIQPYGSGDGNESASATE